MLCQSVANSVELASQMKEEQKNKINKYHVYINKVELQLHWLMWFLMQLLNKHMTLILHLFIFIVTDAEYNFTNYEVP